MKCQKTNRAIHHVVKQTSHLWDMHYTRLKTSPWNWHQCKWHASSCWLKRNTKESGRKSEWTTQQYNPDRSTSCFFSTSEKLQDDPTAVLVRRNITRWSDRWWLRFVIVITIRLASWLSQWKALVTLPTAIWDLGESDKVGQSVWPSTTWPPRVGWVVKLMKTT